MNTGTSAWDPFGDLDEFGCRYWDRAPFHRRASDAFDTSSIISLKDIDRLISSRHTDIRLLDRGVYLHDDGHRESGLVRSDQRTWLSNPSAVLEGLRSGRTIVIPSADELMAPIEMLAKRLEQVLDAAVSARIFLSLGGSLTDWHADKTHSVVLQLYGTKYWSVDCDGTAGIAQVNPPLNVTLEPGDVLYVPRQFMHHVRSRSGVSVHITFSCSTTTWLELAKTALAARCEDRSEEWMHRSVVSPDWGAGSKDRWTKQSHRLINELREAVEDLDADALASLRPTRSRPPSLREGAFLKACEALSVTPQSTVRVRPGLQVLLEEGPEKLELHFDNCCIQLPTWLSPALAVLLNSEEQPLTPTTLPLDSADAIVLVSRLVAEGLLEQCVADKTAP